MTDRVYDRVERRLAELKQEQEQLRQPRVYEPRSTATRDAVQGVFWLSVSFCCALFLVWSFFLR
jgi:hypothetical protein